MTRDEILAMKPGRELDALVAEKVMGWRGPVVWCDDILGRDPFMYHPSVANPRGRSNNCMVPLFSTNIATAWEVVERMKEIDPGIGALQLTGALGVDYIEGSERTWTAHFGHDTSEAYYPGYAAHGATASEAICKAALLAVLEVAR